MTTRQRIDRSREARLWIGQVIVPIAGALLAFPEVREVVKNKVVTTKQKVQNLFTKKGG